MFDDQRLFEAPSPASRSRTSVTHGVSRCLRKEGQGPGPGSGTCGSDHWPYHPSLWRAMLTRSCAIAEATRAHGIYQYVSVNYRTMASRFSMLTRITYNILACVCFWIISCAQLLRCRPSSPHPSPTRPSGHIISQIFTNTYTVHAALFCRLAHALQYLWACSSSPPRRRRPQAQQPFPHYVRQLRQRRKG